MPKMARVAGILIAGLNLVFLSFGLPPNAFEKPADNPVYFFTDSEYSGSRLDLKYVNEVADLSQVDLHGSQRDWGDVINSMLIGRYVRILAYEKPDFEGAKIILEANGYRMKRIADLGKFKWKDRIFAVKIVKNDMAP